MDKTNDVKIILDEKILEKYEEYYFDKYPRRKKKPIESPIIPSINKWMIMKRPQMNDLKQKWKEFIIWVVDYYEFSNLEIDKCNMYIKIFFNTKRRHDPDNYSMKFINDGFTEGGLLIDDSFNQIKRTIIEGDYDKNHLRMEITLEKIE